MIGKVSKGIRTVTAPSKGRGSLEGYMHAASTHLQANGTGYASKAMQTARRPKAPTNLRISQSIPLSMTGQRSTSIYDMRVGGRAGSSVERLKSKMRLDRMF